METTRELPFWKLLNQDWKHHDFQYRPGTNLDTIPFNSNPSQGCVPGGLYFTREDVVAFILNQYGTSLAKVTPIGEYIKDPNTNNGVKFRAPGLNIVRSEPLSPLLINQLWNVLPDKKVPYYVNKEYLMQQIGLGGSQLVYNVLRVVEKLLFIETEDSDYDVYYAFCNMFTQRMTRNNWWVRHYDWNMHSFYSTEAVAVKIVTLYNICCWIEFHLNDCLSGQRSVHSVLARQEKLKELEDRCAEVIIRNWLACSDCATTNLAKLHSMVVALTNGHPLLSYDHLLGRWLPLLLKSFSIQRQSLRQGGLTGFSGELHRTQQVLALLEELCPTAANVAWVDRLMHVADIPNANYFVSNWKNDSSCIGLSLRRRNVPAAQCEVSHSSREKVSNAFSVCGSIPNTAELSWNALFRWYVSKLSTETASTVPAILTAD